MMELSQKKIFLNWRKNSLQLKPPQNLGWNSVNPTSKMTKACCWNYGYALISSNFIARMLAKLLVQFIAIEDVKQLLHFQFGVRWGCIKYDGVQWKITPLINNHMSGTVNSFIKRRKERLITRCVHINYWKNINPCNKKEKMKHI